MRHFLLFLFLSLIFTLSTQAAPEEMAKFEARYLALKAEENWQSIISLGEALLLKSNDLSPAQEALIRNRLASCYFYLGSYTEALQSAQKALNVAVHEKDNEEIELLECLRATLD